MRQATEPVQHERSLLRSDQDMRCPTHFAAFDCRETGARLQIDGKRVERHRLLPNNVPMFNSPKEASMSILGTLCDAVQGAVKGAVETAAVLGVAAARFPVLAPVVIPGTIIGAVVGATDSIIESLDSN